MAIHDREVQAAVSIWFLQPRSGQSAAFRTYQPDMTDKRKGRRMESVLHIHAQICSMNFIPYSYVPLCHSLCTILQTPFLSHFASLITLISTAIIAYALAQPLLTCNSRERKRTLPCRLPRFISTSSSKPRLARR